VQGVGCDEEGLIADAPIGTGGADDVRATGLGDLGGEMADAADRRVDEDPAGSTPSRPTRSRSPP
jgi:hypothetical protein